MNTGTAIVMGVVVLAAAGLAAVVLMRPGAPAPVMTTQPAPYQGPAQQVGSSVDDILRIGAGIIDIVGGLFGNP